MPKLKKAGRDTTYFEIESNGSYLDGTQLVVFALSKTGLIIQFEEQRGGK